MELETEGFTERDHTADWELEVWAPDLPALLVEAARGMYSLSGTQVQEYPIVTRSFELSAIDAEGLLVSFLQELLYFAEMEDIAFNKLSLKVDGYDLQASLQGGKLHTQAKEIKAVTYHNMSIRETERGLEVCIVFDV
ncbi:MAG: archease [Anaerolineales bacterium]|jgi:SHS2 domain-containing protein